MESSNEEIIKMKDTLDNHTKKLDVLLKKKSKTVRMTQIKYVGVPFDQKNYKIGEQEINNALKDGYEVVRDFETGGGIVVCLAKWERVSKDSDEQDTKDPRCYCEVCTE